MTEKARLVDTGSGLAPETPGWFVMNLAEAQWRKNEKFGSVCTFQGEYRFPHTGVNVRLLEPGQPNCYYHEEDRQEDFLVLQGKCLLIVEEQERHLTTWDFVHCPPNTRHVFVGAGQGPCLILMIGDRTAEPRIRYPVSDVARRHEAGVARETRDPKEAYAATPPTERVPCPWPPAGRS